MNKRFRAAIIGGGIGGLTTAYKLQTYSRSSDIPLEIRLFEATEHVGGVIATKKTGDFLLEQGPDCFLSEKPAGMALVRELDLEREIIGTQPEFRKSYILKNDKLLPVPEGFYLMAPGSILPFLRSSLVGISGKIRMLGDLFIPPLSDESTDESLADFVVRRLGKEALNRIAQPMIAGIYAADPALLSLRATMPQFHEMERKHGSLIRALYAKRKRTVSQGTSGPRYSLFCSFRDGMETLPLTLQKKLDAKVIQKNCPVQSIKKASGHWLIQTSKGEEEEFDLCFLSVPAVRAASFLKTISPPTSALLEKTIYSSVAVINFAYREDQIRHPLDGMGFVVPRIEQKHLIGCSFSHRKFSGRAQPGYALLRAFVGEPQKAEDLVATVRLELEEILGISGSPIFSEVASWSSSMPQYTVGHLERNRQMERELDLLPGIFLVGNGYSGVGIPDVIARSESSVQKAVAWLQALSTRS